ncbi:hypothetical protein BHM03_00049276 [Ensete ventricosum]|nr:hypothetical protein BHM03_00049276 [Ensete ventricosum]
MGNTGSSGNGGGSGVGSGRRRNSSLHHRHHHHHPPPFGPAPALPPALQPPEVTANRYVFGTATPYAPQYPNPNPSQYYQYGYYPPPPPTMPVPLPAPFDHHHGGSGAASPLVEHPVHHPGWAGGGRYSPYGAPPPAPPYVDHHMAVTIRNDVNVKKETLRVEPDEHNTEDAYCNLTATKEDSLKPVTVSFKEGLGQKFRQPSGTGIDLSIFNEAELVKVGELDIYPLAVKAEASPPNNQGPEGENQKLGTPNSQITQAMFEKKENGEYHVRVMKQILCVNQSRYELQEIYGIGNSVDNDTDGNDAGKECVICLSEPHDTTVLPCRHMYTHLFKKKHIFHISRWFREMEKECEMVSRDGKGFQEMERELEKECEMVSRDGKGFREMERG